MSTLIWIIISTLIVSLIAFIGIITLLLNEKKLEKILMILVALSTGALMGGAFLHLIPESIEKFPGEYTFVYVLLGFIIFFGIEKVLHWRHCHNQKCSVHTFAYMNLFGDAIHNFIDGLIIATSYMVNINTGIATTIAVILHEVPQEIGDFGVLIYAGIKKVKALFWNFFSALTALAGGIAGYFLSSIMVNSTAFLLPFAAGGFIYISASDLIPEIRKETNVKKSMHTFISFIIGIIIMFAMKLVFAE